MDTKTIRFVPNRPWLNEQSVSRPMAIGKTIPEWYRNADRYAKDPATGKYWEMPKVGGKIPTWKACPAVFDVMGSGYAYLTPCDIEFAEDAAGKLHARVDDRRYADFLQERMPLNQFPTPRGYHEKHFAWWPDWCVELPEGYSALYTHPLNRFELPFLTMSGIVDNDHVHLPGTMPFFFQKGLSGYVPADTPYAQIIPFRREHWNAEVALALNAEQLQAKNQANSDKYRRPDGGIYLNEVWERRKYQ